MDRLYYPSYDIGKERAGAGPAVPLPNLATDSGGRRNGNRPLGILVLTILECLLGVGALALAITLYGTTDAILLAGAYLGNAADNVLVFVPIGVIPDGWSAASQIQSVSVSLGDFGGHVVAALCGLAAYLFVGACGLLARKPWARKIAITLAVGFILLGLAPLLYWIVSKLGILGMGGVKIPIMVILAGLVVAFAGVCALWYLHTRDVKLYFGSTGKPTESHARGSAAWLLLRYLAPLIDDIPTIGGAP